MYNDILVYKVVIGVFWDEFMKEKEVFNMLPEPRVKFDWEQLMTDYVYICTTGSILASIFFNGLSLLLKS